MTQRPFPRDELNQRIDALRQKMAAQDLDGLLISVPENIYYLTGLDHWGFFACHLLLVPRQGALSLMCRKMEAITVENQIDEVEFYGHEDTEEPADFVQHMLEDRNLDQASVGIEKRSLFMTPRIYEMILDRTEKINWHDASGLLDDIRLTQSPLEQSYTRKAAHAADQGTLAAIEAINDGASDYEVSAQCHKAMIQAQSEYPGFGPFYAQPAGLVKSIPPGVVTFSETAMLFFLK